MQIPVGGDGGYERTYPSEDPQIAIIVTVVGIGTQEGYSVRGEEPRKVKQLLIQWVLTEDTIVIKDEELPMLVNEIYTYSLNERSNLYKMIANWRTAEWLKAQKQVDFSGFLGKMGLITLENAPSKKDPSRKFTKVVSFSRVPKSMPLPTAMPGNQPKLLFDILDPTPNWEMFLALQKWIQRKIMESDEWTALIKRKKVPQEVLDYLTEEDEKAEERKKEKPDRAPGDKGANPYDKKGTKYSQEEKEEPEPVDDDAPWLNGTNEEEETTTDGGFEMPSL